MTINVTELTKLLEDLDFSVVAGVPDSLLSPLVTELSKRVSQDHFQITANEGSAVGLAVGGYFASGRPGLVFMQNSGLGNAYNPLSSLASEAVASVPIVLLIGWRGEVPLDGSQINDEPQHQFQGLITKDTLATLEIPFEELPIDGTQAALTFDRAKKTAIKLMKPVAILVRKNSFSIPAPREKRNDETAIFPSRDNYIRKILDLKPKSSPMIATTGFTSRELLSIRQSRGETIAGDYLMVGSMGHAIAIASGVALHAKNRKVVCLDGDGSLLMHAGSLATASQIPNLVHVLINNGVHESVGGQPTAGESLQYSQVASSFNYGNSIEVRSLKEFEKALVEAFSSTSSTFIDCLTSSTTLNELPRPENLPKDAARVFSTFLMNKLDD